MDDTVSLIHHTEVRQPEVLRVLCESIYLRAGDGVGNGFILVVRRRVMVWHTINTFRPETLQAALAESSKRLRTRYLVAVEPVYVELGGTVVHGLNDMRVPNLIK